MVEIPVAILHDINIILLAIRTDKMFYLQNDNF